MIDLSAIRRITFDDATEAAYVRDLTRQRLPLGRMLLLLAAAVFAVLFSWDLLMDPSIAWSVTGPIRLAVVVAFGVLYAASFTQPLRVSILRIAMLAFALVYVPFSVIAAIMPNGFVWGGPAFVFGMIVVPIVAIRLWHAVLMVLVAPVCLNVAMAVSEAPIIAIINNNLWLAGGALMSLGLTYLFDGLSRRIYELERSLEAERDRANKLLLNVLPAEVADELKRTGHSASTAFESATVLFADLVGFTELSRRLEPERLVSLLNDLFSRFDDLAQRHGAEKIKTIGDCYMAVVGVPKPRDDHTVATADLALDMQRAHREFTAEHGLDLGLRIGLHAGPVIAGVIGKTKFAYDLWGDTVNIASRMESHGLPGAIQLSRPAREALPDDYQVTARGQIALKGHRRMRAFLLEGKAQAA